MMKSIIALNLLYFADANRLLQSAGGCAVTLCPDGPCWDNPHTHETMCCPVNDICQSNDYFTKPSVVLCNDDNIYDNKCLGYCAGNTVENCQPICKCNIANDCGKGYQCLETPYGFAGCDENIADSCFGFCIVDENMYTCGDDIGICADNQKCIYTETLSDGNRIGYCASLPDKCENPAEKTCANISPLDLECGNEQTCYDLSSGPTCCKSKICSNGSKCGGPTNTECEQGYECVSNPLSPCQPLFGTDNCAGICVNPNLRQSYCAGLDNCQSYQDVCRHCECGKNGIDTCTQTNKCPTPDEISKMILLPPKCTKCNNGYVLTDNGNCELIKPSCGGFENCEIYNDGCNNCICNENSIDSCEEKICAIPIDGPIPPICILCKNGFHMNKITKQCEKDSINTKCCDPNSRPFPGCFEGIACCPDGTWSCSIGDGKTFNCGVLGQDEFGTVCEEGNSNIECTDSNDCKIGYTCHSDPKCESFDTSCMENTICIDEYGWCYDDTDCGKEYECVLVLFDMFGYCVKYQ
eukprot:131601_1